MGSLLTSSSAVNRELKPGNVHTEQWTIYFVSILLGKPKMVFVQTCRGPSTMELYLIYVLACPYSVRISLVYAK
jgi:hypothetical protein